MANINNPFGFQPYGALQGQVTNFGFDAKTILSTDTTAIFRGDPTITGTSTEAGFIRQKSPGATQVTGIFWDCKYYSIAGKIVVSRPYWPGTSDAANNPFPANIISNPSARFIVQTGASSGSVSPATQANVGNTCDFAYGSPNGNTTTGMSTAYLDLFTAVASAGTTLPFRILQLGSDFLEAGAPGADVTTPYNWVLVGFNFQELRTVTAVA